MEKTEENCQYRFPFVDSSVFVVIGFSNYSIKLLYLNKLGLGYEGGWGKIEKRVVGIVFRVFPFPKTKTPRKNNNTTNNKQGIGARKAVLPFHPRLSRITATILGTHAQWLAGDAMFHRFKPKLPWKINHASLASMLAQDATAKINVYRKGAGG